MGPLVLRLVTPADQGWLRPALEQAWGSVRIVSRERLTEDASVLPGIVAERNDQPVGVCLFRSEGDAMELVVLEAFEPGGGIGTSLLAAAEDEARRRQARRLWLVTTNDNLEALRFYQRRGWRWVALHVDAVTRGRGLKPEIPMVGAHDIEIRHELEFESAAVH